MNLRIPHRICERRAKVGRVQERRAAKGALAAAMEAHRAALRSLAHDLRNSLNGIMLMAQLLEESGPEEAACAARKILRQCKEMDGIVNKVVERTLD